MSRSIRENLDDLAVWGADRLLSRLQRAKHGDDIYHHIVAHFREMVLASEKPSVLEIGARNVSGVRGRDRFAGVEDYVGVDIHPGDCVDVVADVHQLSRHFPPHRFDFAWSVSVFEHLMFPWKVVMELNTVMKTGGHVLMATHASWPAHELPWDFWRFLHHGAHALFNEVTGFEIVAVSEGLPARLFSLVADPPTRALSKCPVNLGIAVIARKVGDYDRERLRWDLVPADVTSSLYPEPAG